jgi:hypothetical protein
MSAQGHERTKAKVGGTSALPPITDLGWTSQHVCFVPIRDLDGDFMLLAGADAGGQQKGRGGHASWRFPTISATLFPMFQMQAETNHDYV